MIFKIILGVLLYILMAKIVYQAEFNYWQNSFPFIADICKKQDKRDSLIFAIGWPIHLIVNVIPNWKEYNKYYIKKTK